MTAVAPPRTAAASAVHATKVYGSGPTAVRALDDVSVDLAAGRFTAVMGPSGSGKSTLLHCLAGLDHLTSGHVFLGGTDLASLSDKELTLLRRDRVGFVFQAFNLVPVLTAGENIVLPLALAGRRPDREWLEEVIATVGVGDRLAHRPSELSGGQQQRVAVARALASRPEVVFADEPTGNLDSRSGAEILGLLRRAVDEMGQTVVMVTHDPVAASYADMAVFLGDARVVDAMGGPTAERVLDRLGRLDAGPGAHCQPPLLGRPPVDDDLPRSTRGPARHQAVGVELGIGDPCPGNPRRAVPAHRLAVGPEQLAVALDRRLRRRHPCNCPQALGQGGVDEAPLAGIRPPVAADGDLGGIADDDVGAGAGVGEQLVEVGAQRVAQGEGPREERHPEEHGEGGGEQAAPAGEHALEGDPQHRQPPRCLSRSRTRSAVGFS
ncbi:MAG TPA: ABC transporter ATP-binding protein, partial [Acidimicrobiales bacterium]|nr:ABC transporter ATP-binding protein [Acidimicrobiales bacterium]